MTKNSSTYGGPTSALSVIAAFLLTGVSEGQPVAPADPDDVPAEFAAETTLPALRSARDTFIQLREFESALNPARTVVEAQETQRDPEYAYDLIALARVQAELSDIEGAETNYLAAIEMISAADGEYSPTLIDVYRGLGRAYIRAAQYPEAITALEQAQHISQRNLGLFNVEQTPLVDDITTAYLGLGDTIQAVDLQRDRLENAIRRFGPDDPRVIPFRYTLAGYYERSRLPESAREQYEEILKSQEAMHGEVDAALLVPLRQLIDIELLIAQGDDTAHRDRLAELVDRTPDANPIDRGLALTTLGDWATVKGDTITARSYYQRAWDAMKESDRIDPVRFFSKPAMIDFVAPLSSVDRNTRNRAYTWEQVVLTFDVTADGLPSNVKIVKGGGRDARLQSNYSRRLRETHFRPRLVDGVPVATTKVQSTHFFRSYIDKRGRLDDEDEEALGDE